MVGSSKSPEMVTPDSVKPKRISPKLEIIFILGVLFGLLVIALFFDFSWKNSDMPIEQFPVMAKEYDSCRIQYNETRDLHTAECCRACNKMTLQYAYDLKKAKSNGELLDLCYCVDHRNYNIVTAWEIGVND